MATLLVEFLSTRKLNLISCHKSLGYSKNLINFYFLKIGAKFIFTCFIY